MAVEVRRHRFSVKDYHRMGEAGVLKADERVELIVPLYARAGVVEVWLVDMPGEAIEVCRRPAGGRYADVRRRGRGHRLACEAFPDVELSVDEVLGSR